MRVEQNDNTNTTNNNHKKKKKETWRNFFKSVFLYDRKCQNSRNKTERL